MNATELKELLIYCYNKNKAVLINGVHGIGKSSIVEQFGKENNIHVEILNLSLMEPGDLLGIPDIDNRFEHKRTSWTEPEWFQKIVDCAWPINNSVEDLIFNDKDFEEYFLSKLKKENIKRKEINDIYCDFYKLDNSILYLTKNQNNIINKKSQNSIIFLDELNRASLDTRQPSLQLSLDKKLQCHILPYVNGKQTFIIAAINPSDLYQTDELDTALLDRFVTVNLDVNVDEWLKYASNNNINEIIISYILENNDHLHYLPKEDKGPSPRAWVDLSHLLENQIETKKVLENIIKGKLGNEIGTEFYIYYIKYKDLFTLENMVEIVFENKNKTIKDIACILNDKMQKVEITRKHTLLKQLFFVAEKELISNNYNIMSYTLISYLMSLNQEISLMQIKKLKNSNITLYNSLVKLDDHLNNKLFFSNLVKHI